VERVLDESSAEALEGVLRLQPSVREGILRAKARLEWAERTIDALSGRGVSIVRMTDPVYPAALRELADGPPLLYAFGRWDLAESRGVGMVGATRPSQRGRDIARGLAARLAERGVTVVSGYALGVDDASHLGALEHGGATVLCVPFGIRRFEPRAGWPGGEALARQALILSEQPPDAAWETQAALSRNRLIAALSRALIIVETSAKGGAMNTFEHARRLGRPVFAVRVQEAPDSGRGNAVALGKGARPIGRFGDIDEVLAAIG